jgi:hypothetical protein
VFVSTFPSEFVTISDGSDERTLFCKHGTSRRDEESGHWRGTPYEAAVYAGVLADRAPAPACVGSFEGAHGTTLVLEAIRDLSQLTTSRLGHDSALVRAAGALGRWHRRRERACVDAPGWLNRYDEDHLVRWAAAITEGRPGPLLRGHARVQTIRAAVDLLVSAPATLVHGELFPPNALASRHRTVFIDWETAGVGAGELDLAFMTVGWPAALRRWCADAYVTSRWPAGAPRGFKQTLAAARLYALAFVDRDLQRGVDRNDSTRWIDAQLREASVGVD